MKVRILAVIAVLAATATAHATASDDKERLDITALKTVYKINCASSPNYQKMTDMLGIIESRYGWPRASAPSDIELQFRITQMAAVFAQNGQKSACASLDQMFLTD